MSDSYVFEAPSKSRAPSIDAAREMWDATKSSTLASLGMKSSASNPGIAPDLSPFEAKWGGALVKGLAELHASSTNQSLAALSRDGLVLPPRGVPGRGDLESVIKKSSTRELGEVIARSSAVADRLKAQMLATQMTRAMERAGLEKSSVEAQRDFANNFSRLSPKDRIETSGTMGLSKQDLGKLVGLQEGLAVMRSENVDRDMQMQHRMAMESRRQMAAGR